MYRRQINTRRTVKKVLSVRTAVYLVPDTLHPWQEIQDTKRMYSVRMIRGVEFRFYQSFEALALTFTLGVFDC